MNDETNETPGQEQEEKDYMAHIMEQYHAINALPLDQRRKLRPVVDYAQRRGYWMDGDGETDLFGFGTAKVIMYEVGEDPDGDDDIEWVALGALENPTGLTREELVKLFRHYKELDFLPEDELIEIQLTETEAALLVTVDFAQLLMLEHSLWSSVVRYNLSKMMLRGLYESGAYKNAKVGIYSRDEEGNIHLVKDQTMSEFFQEHGVPSEEEAEAEAYKGLSVEYFMDNKDGDNGL